MNAKYSIGMTIIGLIGIFFVSQAWASGARTIELESDSWGSDAKGTAAIDRNHINIQASGLEPNSVYTVWFVNTKPEKHETGAGTAPYMFRTDNQGNGSYSAPLEESPFGKWAMVMVVLHPDGDPENMKNMKGALKAEL